MSLGLGLKLGLKGSRSSFFELKELVQTLGGHIFAPGLETYADQAALNPAASALDSQVGYVGSAATQGLGENLIPNSEAVGATPSTPATGWTLASSWGITVAVVGAGTIGGVPYQDIRFSGTSTGTAYPSIQFDNPVALPNAFAGQLWSTQAKAALIAGSYAGFSGNYIALRVDGCNSSGVFIEQVAPTSFSSVTTSNLTQLTTTGRVSNISSVRARNIITGTVLVGQTVDLTIRIAQPQLERGHPTNYTPTYGTAISRGTFASAAQGALANTPKLVALGNARGLEFDGSTDHLVTDITTPSSGYICVIGRQTANTSATRAWLGSNTYNSAGVNLGITETGDAGIYTNNGTNNQGAITSGLGYVPGTLAIIDADWQPSFRSIRVNGGNEASSSATANPATSACFILGGRNSATWPNVTLNIPVAGQFFSCIIIPGVTLPAATKQRIRKLVGQIYGVQTQ